MSLLLLIILTFLLVGSLPSWNERPLRKLGPILIFVLILILMEYVPLNLWPERDAEQQTELKAN